ncbi:MAG: hypothetical protein ACYSWZ_01410 [Planctomycetota bacterium]|jgi:hypothetical protein
MKTIKSHYIAVLICSAIFFAGCAVLTVDVDVYKGPLANHKDVQTEQMAAMAIGAKPLLVELEEQLDNCIAAEDPNSDKIFKEKMKLGRVKAVLSLYKDNDLTYVPALLKKGGLAVSRFITAYSTYTADRSAEQNVWERLEKNARSRCGVKGLSQKQTKRIQCLKEKYKKFLVENGQYRQWKPVLRKHEELWDILDPNQKELLDNIDPNELAPFFGNLANSNEGIEALANKKLLQAHAQLFYDDPNKRNVFVNEVWQVASSFNQSRKALADLLEINLRMLAAIHDINFETTTTKRRALRDTAAIIARLIQLEHLWLALGQSTSNDNIVLLRRRLKTKLKLSVDWLEEDSFWKEKNRKKIEHAMIEIMADEPEKMSDALLEANQVFIVKPPISQDPNLNQKYSSDSRRRYGLVGGPTDEKGKFTTESIDELYATSSQSSGGLLSEGRLTKGLNRLINEYLIAANPNAHGQSPDEREVERTREILIGALVRFSQKLLFMANNNSLLQDPTENDVGILLELGDLTKRGLFGPSLPDKRVEQNKYVRILQAVGNSILVQADALRQEQAHEKKMTEGVDSEIYAINRTLTQLPSRVIDRLLQSLRAEQAAITREIEKAKIELSAAKEKLDEANKDLEEAKNQISNITPTNEETFVKVAKHQEREVISAHLLLVSKQPGDQTVLKARKLAAEAKVAALGREPAPNSPNKCAKALAEELATKAERVKVPNVKDLLSSAGTYFTDKPNKFSLDDCQNANKAYEEVISEVKIDYSMVKPWIELAIKADKAQERVDNQKKIVGDINTSVDNAKRERTKVEHAISAIVDAKYTVLSKADKAGSKITAKFVYELLKETLKESRANAKSKPKVSEKLTNAINVLSKKSPPIEPIVVDMSKLPSKPSAKEVRDLWITVLQYEHDLALSNGEKPRADEIMEALEAARKKREGMIFIRPAMAYLRTSFPATSLQNNPNLTWDNMLGGHMMRSIPFGPGINEFFNPDAKRDARINAEIDKQFWQNINRVRVAGGGFTNYAVVKDDIGNWYVKGYSSNPEDVIKSAKNLAMFSLSAKMNTNFVGRNNREQGGLPGTDKPDGNQTAVERMYNKYKDQYDSRTKTDSEQLIELLKSEMRSAIMQAWQQNEGLKGSIGKLNNKLDAAIKLHLKKLPSELKKAKDVTKRGSKIVSALHAIRRFHNTLLANVHDTITGPARDKLSEKEKKKAAKESKLNDAKKKYSDAEKAKDIAEINWENRSSAAAEDPDNPGKKQLSDKAKDELKKAQKTLSRAEANVAEKQAAFEEVNNEFEIASTEYDKAERAEKRAIQDVRQIVREKVMVLMNSRMNSIKEYETALMFIGESSKQ